MTPSPETAPATIATKPFALRAQAFATTVAACAPPGNQATSTPTTTDARWGHFKPSRRGQCKPSFSTATVALSLKGQVPPASGERGFRFTAFGNRNRPGAVASSARVSRCRHNFIAARRCVSARRSYRALCNRPSRPRAISQDDRATQGSTSAACASGNGCPSLVLRLGPRRAARDAPDHQ